MIIQKNAAEYEQLHINKHKRQNTINYNLACEAKSLLPPNLRDKLIPYNWPKCFDQEIVTAINKHEQETWKKALNIIANTRHQAIVDDLEKINFKISRHQCDDHIDIQLKEYVHDIINHPTVLAEQKAKYMAIIANFTFTPIPKNHSVVQSQARLAIPKQSVPKAMNIDTTSPSTTSQETPTSAPLRSSMKRPRTTQQPSQVTTQTPATNTNATPNQLAIQLNQLTLMFQSLITKVDNLEQKSSRNSSRSSSPMSTQRQPTQQTTHHLPSTQMPQPNQLNQTQYRHHIAQQQPPPPPPPMPYNFSPPQQHPYYYPDNRSCYPEQNPTQRRVHYN